jgi:hypothetical protein
MDDVGGPVGRTVRSRKVKLDGIHKAHAARVVRRGPEGVWLFSPAGMHRALSSGYQEAFDGLGWRLLAEVRGRSADEH